MKLLFGIIGFVCLLSLTGALGATTYTLDKYTSETEEHDFRGKGAGLGPDSAFIPGAC
jgi:hypothetical protein